MRYVFVFLMLAMLVGCSSDKVSLEVRLADNEPGEGLTAITHEKSGEIYYLHDEVILSNKDVARAKVVDMEGKPFIEVYLTDAAKDRFAEITGENISRHAAILIDGKLVMAPVIRAKIDQGVAMIDGDFTKEVTERVAEGLNSKDN